MSQTSIELTALTEPQPTAKSTASLRRPSTINAPSDSSLHEHDGASALGLELERSVTITSKSRTAVIIASVTLITGISTLLNGLTTVALPTMAKELDIPDSLLLWPSSIQALTNGCTLLLSGTIADALGARFMYLTGCVLQAGFILGCGLAKSTTQLYLISRIEWSGD